MYTLIDYLNNYKNISIKEVHWNEMDNLLCSILVYLPIKSFSKTKNIKELYNYSINNSLESFAAMDPVSDEILRNIHDSIRYSHLKISNFINNRDDTIQFGACTFRINGKTIVSFKGTDGSLIGWIENFRVAYEYPTITHKEAIKYLNNTINLFRDKQIYVLGHSKGGNLAIVASMQANNNIFNRIEKIYNFDGPGLRKEEFDSDNYSKILPKLENILPEYSIVGVLLNNSNYKIVKSSNFAFNEHYPNSWNTFGEFFIEGKLSKISSQLHENTTNQFNDLDKEKVKLAFETLFQNIDKDYSSSINMSLEDMVNFIKNIKKIDPEISSYFEKIFNSIISASRINNK